MKPVNLLPKNIVKRIELNKFFIKCTACAAVIFLSIVLLVLGMDMSAGIISKEIESLYEMLLDEKYEETDKIAAEMRERLVKTENQMIPDMFMETEPIDLDIVALLSDIILSGQDDEGFLLMEKIICENAEKIEMTGIASERELLRGFVKKLNSENIFTGIDVPQVVFEENGIYKFKLILGI